MAQIFTNEDPELVQSPRPLLPESQDSIHPGLRPSLTNIPVTPGIGLGEYDSTQSTGTSSYFTTDLKKLRDNMETTAAQSPSDAAAGATTNADILRRMSLTAPDLIGSAPVVEVDPRAGNPALGLSGGIISATFCIPHSLKLRKGSDWVRYTSVPGFLSPSNLPPEPRDTPWYFSPLRLLQISLIRQNSMESYIGRVDW
jgi:hypothetical protein